MRTMMRCLFCSVCVILFACSEADRIPEDIRNLCPDTLRITVKNSLNDAREDAAVVLDVQRLKERVSVFNPNACIVWSGREELSSQFIDGDDARIVVMADFRPNEMKQLHLCYRQAGKVVRNYPKRTQAELSHKVGGRFINRVYEGGTFENVQKLRVPQEHTDHSFYIRYEGPGWESDRVGYRFYLDWRNAIDIFGKKVPDMVLRNVGQDGFDSYHEMSDWGMDILKVGDALGIGSLGMWVDGKARRISTTDSVTCQIVADGPVYSQIRTEYFGWDVGGKKYSVTSDLSIKAGSRITWHTVKVVGNPDNLCTGLVKHEDARLFQSDVNSGWGYLALYGKQSLSGDDLGMAIFYRTDDLIEKTEDKLNHVLVLMPKDGRLKYGFAAAWEQEPDGIGTEEAFIDYLEKTVTRLNAPLLVND